MGTDTLLWIAGTALLVVLVVIYLFAEAWTIQSLVEWVGRKLPPSREERADDQQA